MNVEFQSFSLGIIYSLDMMYYTTVPCVLSIHLSELCIVFFVMLWLLWSLLRPDV